MFHSWFLHSCFNLSVQNFAPKKELCLSLLRNFQKIPYHANVDCSVIHVIQIIYVPLKVLTAFWGYKENKGSDSHRFNYSSDFTVQTAPTCELSLM